MSIPVGVLIPSEIGVGAGIAGFHPNLESRSSIRPVLLGSVYDPTLGDDRRNFSGVDPKLARTNLKRMNTAIADIANRYGKFVDLHAHFLQGDSLLVHFHDCLRHSTGRDRTQSDRSIRSAVSFSAPCNAINAALISGK